MTVFKMYMNRMFKFKFQLLLLVILPVIFVLFIIMNTQSHDMLKLYVADNDGTAFSKEIVARISSNAELVSGITDIKSGLVESKIEYALLIEKGATKSILDGDSDLSGKISGYCLKGSMRSQAAQQYLDAILAKAVNASPSANGDENKLTELVTSALQSDLVKINKIGDIDRDRSYLAMGTLVLFSMMGSMLYTVLIIGDKEKRTLYRSLAAPLNMRSYLFQAILAFSFIAVIMVTLMMFSLKKIAGLYLGDSFIGMYTMFLLLALISVSFGVAIAGFFKGITQSVFSGLGIIFPMSFLGGCWWETSTTGAVMDSIGKFFPLYWIMDGMKKVLYNKAFSDIAIDIIISLLFAAVLFMLGSWRKQEVPA